MSLELERLLLEPRQKLAKVLSCDDAGPISNTRCSTDIRANLLRRWAHVAQDPGISVCDWLTNGAPAGIAAEHRGRDDIFSRADEDDPDDVAMDANFVARSTAAHVPEAARQSEDYGKRDWLQQTTREQLQAAYGSDFTVSNFCVLTKTKKWEDEEEVDFGPQEERHFGTD